MLQALRQFPADRGRVGVADPFVLRGGQRDEHNRRSGVGGGRQHQVGQHNVRKPQGQPKDARARHVQVLKLYSRC